MFTVRYTAKIQKIYQSILLNISMKFIERRCLHSFKWQRTISTLSNISSMPESKQTSTQDKIIIDSTLDKVLYQFNEPKRRDFMYLFHEINWQNNFATNVNNQSKQHIMAKLDKLAKSCKCSSVDLLLIINYLNSQHWDHQHTYQMCTNQYIEKLYHKIWTPLDVEKLYKFIDANRPIKNAEMVYIQEIILPEKRKPELKEMVNSLERQIEQGSDNYPSLAVRQKIEQAARNYVSLPYTKGTTHLYDTMLRRALLDDYTKYTRYVAKIHLTKLQYHVKSSSCKDSTLLELPKRSMPNTFYRDKDMRTLRNLHLILFKIMKPTGFHWNQEEINIILNCLEDHIGVYKNNSKKTGNDDLQSLTSWKNLVDKISSQLKYRSPIECLDKLIHMIKKLDFTNLIITLPSTKKDLSEIKNLMKDDTKISKNKDHFIPIFMNLLHALASKAKNHPSPLSFYRSCESWDETIQALADFSGPKYTFEKAVMEIKLRYWSNGLTPRLPESVFEFFTVLKPLERKHHITESLFEKHVTFINSPWSLDESLRLKSAIQSHINKHGRSDIIALASIVCRIFEHRDFLDCYHYIKTLYAPLSHDLDDLSIITNSSLTKLKKYNYSPLFPNSTKSQV